MNSKVIIKLIMPALGFLSVILLAGYHSLDVLQDLKTTFWNGSPDDMTGLTDMYNYVRIMRAFLQHDFQNSVLHFWAPGFPLLLALVVRLSGEVHYFAKVFFLDVAFWTASFTCIYQLLDYPKNKLLKFVLLSSLWLFPNFRYWSLGQGYLLSESISHSFVLVGFILLCNGILEGNKNRIFLSAFMMGIAANFRALLDFSFSFTSYLLLITTLIYLTYRWIGRDVKEKDITLSQAIRRSPVFRTLIISFLILNGLVMPWKSINYLYCHQYAFSCGGVDVEWQIFHWSKEEEYPEVFRHWVKGGDPACHADPGLCEIVKANRPQIDPFLFQFSLMTLIRHPLKWAKYKLQNVNWLWVGQPWGSWREQWAKWLEGLFCLFAGGTGFLLLLRSRRFLSPDEYKRAIVLVIVSVAVIISYCGIFSFLHYEDRYSVSLRLYFLVLFYFGLVLKKMKKDYLPANLANS